MTAKIIKMQNGKLVLGEIAVSLAAVFFPICIFIVGKLPILHLYRPICIFIVGKLPILHFNLPILHFNPPILHFYYGLNF